MSREIAKTDHLTTQVCQFEKIQLPANIDLINASFSLPFCSPEAFPILWHQIVTALPPGGIFCGHLFGNHDSWAKKSSMNFHTRKQVEQLLEPFEIEILDEEDKPGKTALDEAKHWHIFHIVACKKLLNLSSPSPSLESPPNPPTRAFPSALRKRGVARQIWGE